MWLHIKCICKKLECNHLTKNYWVNKEVSRTSGFREVIVSTQNNVGGKDK